MSTPSTAGVELTEQQKQQRTMMAFMPLVFTLMFYHFPSGLNIYWLSSMLLAMVQQWWMQRNMKPVTPSVIEVKPTKVKKS